MKLIKVFALLLALSSCTDWQYTYDEPKTGSGTSLITMPIELTPQDLGMPEPESRQLGALARVGGPLEPGTYTYFFKDCEYDRQQYTILQFKLYETLTTNIHFIKGPSWEESDIRLICSDEFGWVSYLGTDIFKLPKEQWTTSLGQLYSPQYVEYATKHEIWGHLINGMEHEQHNSRAGIKWNMPELYKYFKKNYNWDPARVDLWLKRDVRLELSLGDVFDAESFMLYLYDCSLITDGVGCGTFNYVPSKGDIRFFQRNHGTPAQPN